MRHLVLVSVLLSYSLVGSAADQGAAFESASSLAETQRRQRLMPSDDIWWTVPGEQMAWNNKNLHQLFPTVNVYRSGPVRELQQNLDSSIPTYQVQTRAGIMNFEEFVDGESSTTMGLVILHQGKIVYEHYPRMQPYEKPITWSVAKVIPSTLVRLLEERGLVDVSKEIEFYLPELSNSAIAGVSVRNILDMATGLDCADEYETRESCYYRYSMSIGDGFRDSTAADNPYDFMKSLEVSSHAEQGRSFSYSGMNSFVLAWLVEEITGESLQDVFSREVWQHIGAESDASFLAYRYGIPLSHGGFLSNLRDLARFGLLYTPSYGVVSESKIISDEYLDLLLHEPNPNLVRPDRSHNIYQWDRVDEAGFMYKGGWAGQGLVVNPELDIVVTWAGYYAEDYSQEALKPILDQVLRGIYREH